MLQKKVYKYIETVFFKYLAKTILFTNCIQFIPTVLLSWWILMMDFSSKREKVSWKEVFRHLKIQENLKRHMKIKNCSTIHVLIASARFSQRWFIFHSYHRFSGLFFLNFNKYILHKLYALIFSRFLLNPRIQSQNLARFAP